jgi:3'(2'), 5'-bisphosphate nucleotidase
MTDIDSLAPALLARAAELATRAAAVIMQIRGRGFETLTKADESPVTEADHAAEAIILEGLRQPVAGRPSIPVIAEEEVAAGQRVDPGDCFWLVDPLDGTREFAAGRESFTVNIGLVHKGRVVLGAVALPACNQLYLGIVGQGALRRDADGEHQIHARVASAEGLTVLASRHYANDPTLLAYLGTQRIASVDNIGSAAKFVRIAEGAADLYPRLGRTMEWDTAAPQAVLEAAGGSVRLFDGTPLRYGKPGWENPHFVCRGRMEDGAA